MDEIRAQFRLATAQAPGTSPSGILQEIQSKLASIEDRLFPVGAAQAVAVPILIGTFVACCAVALVYANAMGRKNPVFQQAAHELEAAMNDAANWMAENRPLDLLMRSLERVRRVLYSMLDRLKEAWDKCRQLNAQKQSACFVAITGFQMALQRLKEQIDRLPNVIGYSTAEYNRVLYQLFTVIIPGVYAASAVLGSCMDCTFMIY